MRRSGRRLVRRLVEQPWYQAAQRVALFAAIRNEPSLDEVRQDCVDRGVRTAYPRVRSGALEFAYVERLEELLPGAFGIREPRQGQEVALDRIDLVLTPGLVFDESGGRIGYGKGYYDRAFARAANPLRVGICWDWQVLGSDRRTPRHPGDIGLDGILTERRLIPCTDRLVPPPSDDRRDAP